MMKLKYLFGVPIPSFQGRFPFREYLLACVGILVLVRLIQTLVNRMRRKMRGESGGTGDRYQAYYSLPQPWTFPLRVIGNGWLFLTNTDVIGTLQTLFRNYGPCYRLTLLCEEYVVLNTAPLVQALLMSNDTGHFGRGPFEEMIWPEGVLSLLTFTGNEWKCRRKMLNRAFTYKSLQIYNNSFNKHSDKLVVELEELFKDGKLHDIDGLVKQCICRLSSDTLMGVDLSETEDGATFCECTEIAIQTTFDRVYRPWLYPSWIWRLHPLSRKNKEALDKMGSVTRKIIRNHSQNMEISKENAMHQEFPEDDDDDCHSSSENASVSNSMIEVMLRHGVPEKQIFDEVAVMLAVAHDTTSVSVLYALLLLSVYPQHQRLCREEIDAVFNDPSKCNGETLKFEALSELKYLERCLLESQRIYPLATTMRKLKTPLRLSDDLVIPPGVSACFLSHVLHMNPDYFPNPQNFDPDRFLPANVRARHPYAFVAFSAGPRNCLGMKLAIIELKVIVAKILRNFEVSTPETRETLKTVFIGIPKPAKPINFLLTRRNVQQQCKTGTQLQLSHT